MSNKTYIISEIGINHNGNIELAKSLIQKSAVAGADAVKFQKRTISEVYSEDELNKHRDSPWGTTNRQQKEGLEFSLETYKELQDYTEFLGLDFIVSCWDLSSLRDVEEHLNVKYHKVASALTTNREFLEALNATNKPVILSTGMCTTEQIAGAMKILDNVEFLLACTSTYPTIPQEVNLAHITTLTAEYPNTKIGFSNHYNGQDAVIGAVALGAACIEFHVTQDRTMYGSDQAASIEKIEALVQGVRNIEKMIGDGIKVVYDSEIPVMNKLRKVDNVTT